MFAFLFHSFKASGLDLSQVSLNYIRDQIQEILTTQAQLDNLRFSNVAVKMQWFHCVTEKQCFITCNNSRKIMVFYGQKALFLIALYLEVLDIPYYVILCRTNCLLLCRLFIIIWNFLEIRLKYTYVIENSIFQSLRKVKAICKSYLLVFSN